MQDKNISSLMNAHVNGHKVEEKKETSFEVLETFKAQEYYVPGVGTNPHQYFEEGCKLPQGAVALAAPEEVQVVKVDGKIRYRRPSYMGFSINEGRLHRSYQGVVK